MAKDGEWANKSKKVKRAYLNNMGALYGDNLPVAPAPVRKTHNHDEQREQIILATWLSKENILFYHVPNGGRRGHLEAIRLKRMGVKSGVPDICIPIARKGFHGLYGELKRKDGGQLSDNQRWWLSELEKQGYYVFEAHGADEFIQHVKNYIKP